MIDVQQLNVPRPFSLLMIQAAQHNSGNLQSASEETKEVRGQSADEDAQVACKIVKDAILMLKWTILIMEMFIFQHSGMEMWIWG